MAAVAAFALGAIFGLHCIAEADLFQQVAVGRAILADPASLGVSTLHHTVADRPYVEDKWLASVAVALVDRLGGEPALMLYQIGLAGLVAGCWFWMLRAWGGAPPAALLGVALGLVCCAYRLEPRPDTWSIALLALLLGALRSQTIAPRLRWVVPLLMAFWANVHGYFVVGLLVLLAAVLASRLGDAVGPTGHLLQTLGLSVVACAVRPQGIEALLWPMRQIALLGRHPFYAEAILEFRPTTLLFTGMRPWHGVLLAIALAGAVVSVRLSVRGRVALSGLLAAPWLLAPPPGLTAWPYRLTFALVLAALLEIGPRLRERRVFGALLFGGLALLAAPMIRNLTLLVPAALLMLVPAWGDRLGRTRLRAGLVLALVVFVGWVRLADRLPPGDFRGPRLTGWGIDRALVPVGAADFVLSHHLPGELLNHFDNGGYLLYRFHPQRRAFISGNTSTYPPDFFRGYHREVIGRDGDLDRLASIYGIRTAILDHASPETELLVRKLAGHPEWSPVFVDAAASVFVRGGAGPDTWLDPAPREPALASWLLPRRHVYPALNLARFWRAAGRPERGVASLEYALRAEPGSAEIRSWLARARYLRGVNGLDAAEHRDSARADLERALELAPEEPGPYLALARLDAERGDPVAARRRLHRVLEAFAGDDRVRRAAEGDPVLGPLLSK